jgi:hypothetical protein
MGCLIEGTGSKAGYIRRAATGKSKEFSAVFVEVNEAFKAKKKEQNLESFTTQKILGIALQVYCQRRGKGTAEYKVWLGGDKYELDWLKILGIKPETIDRNVRAYIDAKGEKKCASIQVPPAVQ